MVLRPGQVFAATGVLGRHREREGHEGSRGRVEHPYLEVVAAQSVRWMLEVG